MSGLSRKDSSTRYKDIQLYESDGLEILRRGANPEITLLAFEHNTGDAQTVYSRMLRIESEHRPKASKYY